MKWSKAPSVGSLLLLASLLVGVPATAQEADINSQTPARAPLKGGVKGAVLRTEDGLIKMGEAIEELKNATNTVMTEVTRKQTTFVRGPNVIGPGVIIPALGGPSGTIPFGDLPARKKQLDRFVNNTTYYVELLQNEVDALILPDELSPELNANWKSIRAIMQEIQGHLAKLKALCVGPKFDNNKIGREAVAIFDHAKTVNTLRKKVLQIVQAE